MIFLITPTDFVLQVLVQYVVIHLPKGLINTSLAEGAGRIYRLAIRGVCHFASGKLAGRIWRLAIGGIFNLASDKLVNVKKT